MKLRDCHLFWKITEKKIDFEIPKLIIPKIIGHMEVIFELKDEEIPEIKHF